MDGCSDLAVQIEGSEFVLYYLRLMISIFLAIWWILPVQAYLNYTLSGWTTPIDGTQLSCSCPSAQSDKQAVYSVLSLHLVLLRAKLSYGLDSEAGPISTSPLLFIPPLAPPLTRRASWIFRVGVPANKREFHATLDQK